MSSEALDIWVFRTTPTLWLSLNIVRLCKNESVRATREALIGAIFSCQTKCLISLDVKQLHCPFFLNSLHWEKKECVCVYWEYHQHRFGRKKMQNIFSHFPPLAVFPHSVSWVWLCKYIWDPLFFFLLYLAGGEVVDLRNKLTSVWSQDTAAFLLSLLWKDEKYFSLSSQLHLIG